MDEPSTVSATPESNDAQQQQDAKPSWPDFMKVQDFVADPCFG